MERLEKAWASWQAFIPEREEARAQSMGSVDLNKKRRLADLKVELAQIRAKIATLQAEIGQEKVSYVKGAFDANWSVEKAQRRQELEDAIAEQINVHGKTGYQLANHLGTKNINMFYEVKRQGDVYRGHQEKEVSVLNWQWHRFTGTQRYALASMSEDPTADYHYVLMKGTIDTDLEHKECVWDFQTGAYVSGDKKVFESDNAGNRRQRATRLAQVLEGTYVGKIKESPNPYFESVDN